MTLFTLSAYRASIAPPLFALSKTFNIQRIGRLLKTDLRLD